MSKSNSAKFDRPESMVIQPLEKILWIPTALLSSNDWNPNVVFDRELALLKFSILKQGWIQPLMAGTDGKTSGPFEIIDGFHRWWLTHNDKEISAMTGGTVPVCLMDIPQAERMLLTIRINRAKGKHVAAKMSSIVRRVHFEFGVSRDEIGDAIGAGKEEVELLLCEDVFAKKKTATHSYSRAWKPAGTPMGIPATVDKAFKGEDKATLNSAAPKKAKSKK